MLEEAPNNLPLSLSFCSSKVGHKGPVLSTHNPLGVATPKNITPTMFNLMKRDKDKDGGRKEKKEKRQRDNDV